MYSLRSDIGSASTNSGEPTAALANDLGSCNVRDLFSVTTICRTSSFRDCASAYFTGPDPPPNSTHAIVNGRRSKVRQRVERCELLTDHTIRQMLLWLLRIAGP